jgi:hypothetical protein
VDQLGALLPAFAIAEGALIPRHFFDPAIMRFNLVVGANGLGTQLAGGKVEIVGQHSFKGCDCHEMFSVL